MAQHSKRRRSRSPRHNGPGRSPFATASVRAAATLTLASAASAGIPGGAVADPEPSRAEVERRVDALHREAEEATERYNAAAERAEQAREELDELRDRAALRTGQLNDARRELGAHAAAQYRSAGMPSGLLLALSSDPDAFLRRASVAERAGDRQAGAVQAALHRMREIERLRTEAAEQSEVLDGAEDEAREHREEVETRLAEAQDLLEELTAEERARLLEQETAPGTGRGGGPAAASAERPSRETATPTPPPVSAPAAGTRAATAVAFAYAQLGKPYSWGATGPGAYDCSGLTQAAWRAAGVALPRTSSQQAGAGTPVSVGELVPGDLVFYYSGLSHVGIYVGGGQIVHASRPGTPVRTAPVGSMPIAAATRPA